MAFDAITYAAAKKIQLSNIGTLTPVASTFTSTNMVESGKVFSPTAYPELASIYPAGFNGDVFEEKLIPSFPSSLNTIFEVIGDPILNWVYNSEYYLLFNNGAVFKTTGTDVSTFNQIATLNIGVALVKIYAAVMRNGYLVISTNPAGSYRFPTSNLLAAGVALTMPVVSTLWQYEYYNGLWIAINSAIVNNNFYTSSDGLTFTVSTNTLIFPATSKPISIAVNGIGVWLISANSAQVARSVDGITWTASGVGLAGGFGVIRVHPTLNTFVAAPATTITATRPFYATTTSAATSWTTSTTPTGSIINNIQCLSDGSGWVASTGALLDVPAVSIAQTIGVLTSASGTANPGVWTIKSGVSGMNRAGDPVFYHHYAAVFDNTVVVFGTCGDTRSQFSGIVSTDRVVTLSSTSKLVGNTPTTAVRAPIFITGGLIGILPESAPTIDTASQWHQGKTWSGLRTTDGGLTWNSWFFEMPGSSSPLTSSFQFYRLVATPDRFLLWGYIAAQAGATSTTALNVNGIVVAFSSLDGLTWTQTNTVGTSSIAAPQTLTVTNNTIWLTRLTVANTSLVYSKDGGATWVTTTQASPISATVPATMGKKFIAFTATSNSYIGNDLAQPFYNVNIPAFGSLSLGSSAGNDSKAIIILTGSTAGYATLDGGSSWYQITSPIVQSTSIRLQVIKDWFLIYTGTGQVYRSTDAKSWNLINVGNDVSLASDWAWTSTSPDDDNSIGYLGGALSATRGSYLRSSEASHSIPPVPSLGSGYKWVVRAK